MTDDGDTGEPSRSGRAGVPPPLEMERGRRGLFQLRRRPRAAGEGQPLWVRVGLRSRVPLGLALTVTAAACALVGAAVLLALALAPDLAR